MKENKKSSSKESRVGRRGFLQAASFAAASLALPGSLGARSPGRFLRRLGGPRHTTMLVFLRGGADGLSILAPVGDTSYTGVRPNIAIPSGPGTDIAGTGGYWARPAAFDALMDGTPGNAWNNRDLALIPAVGLKDENNSHFVAQNSVELGALPGGTFPSSGFLARHLLNASFPTEPVLRGLVLGKLATKAFAGAPLSLAIGNIEEFGFPGSIPASPSLLARSTEAMHANVPGPLGAASQAAFSAISYLDPANVNYMAPMGPYPSGDFGDQFKRAAALILNGDPPELMQIDIGGWDTHTQQGPNAPGGTMFGRMTQLSEALAAFYFDMAGPYPHAAGETWRDRVTVVVVSEFGRRIQENGDMGTDHGWGGAMLAMGARVNGGVQDAHWPSLQMGGMTRLDQVTSPNGNVIAVVDQRDVFAEALIKLMGLDPGPNGLGLVYPSYTYLDRMIFS